MTGLPINPYFSAYKFAWLLENVQGVKSAVEDGTVQFGTIDTYLIWRLTGMRAVCRVSQNEGTCRTIERSAVCIDACALCRHLVHAGLTA